MVAHKRTTDDNLSISPSSLARPRLMTHLFSESMAFPCRNAESLFFVDSNSDSRGRKLGLRLRAQNQTPIPTLGLTVCHNDCVLKDDLREILNYSNKICATMYRVLVVK